MKCLSISEPAGNLDTALAAAASISPSLVLLFAAPSILRDSAAVAKISRKLSMAQLVGCSTSGEISGRGVSDGTISLMAVRLDRSDIKCVSVSAKAEDAVKAISARLAGPKLRAVFVLAPGTGINGGLLAHGLEDHLPKNIVISGGLAGDGVQFGATATLLNDRIASDQIVAIGFYGDHLDVRTGARGGWRIFGPARRVTRSEKNIIYELDGKPALKLYKQYLGDKADRLPASGLLYPLAIMHEDQSTTGLIRVVVNVDPARESLILVTDIEQNCLVSLMHADTESLVNGATEAIREACIGPSNDYDDGFAVLVSCVGRKLVMGGDADDEIDVAKDIFGADVALSGFYSYGEISKFHETGRIELHNQTMTVTRFSERRIA